MKEVKGVKEVKKSAGLGAAARPRITPYVVFVSPTETVCSSGEAYASIGGQAHMRFRSPYGLSIRETGGQNLR
jgi:hypothetical protein